MALSASALCLLILHFAMIKNQILCQVAPALLSPSRHSVPKHSKPKFVTQTRCAAPLRQHISRNMYLCAGVAAAASGASPEQSSFSPNAGGRSITVAVDTSPASKSAMAWVLENLVRPGDVVHLAHCVPALEKAGRGIYTMPDGRVAVVDFEKLLHSEDEYLKAVERVVADWAWSIFHPAGVPYVIDVMKEAERAMPGDKGEIARELCAKAAELGSVALVLTPHGRGGLGELVMGSVAADCSRHCDVPVVVLHEEETGKRKERIGGKSAALVRWLGDSLARLGHPGTGGTAVEAIAEAAVQGVLHAAEPHRGVVSDSDFLSEEENLIGQAVGELPGTDASLPGVDPEAEASKSAAAAPPLPGAAGGRRVVVAVDDSDASERACRWTAQNLVKPGDTIHLLHVIPSLPAVAFGTGPMSGLSGSFLYVLEPPTAAFKEATEAYMERRFHGMLRDAGVQFQSDILLEMTDGGASSVGRALLDRTDALEAAAVVVGSHGRGGVPELLLGSVATWLGHHSERPVVVLH